MSQRTRSLVDEYGDRLRDLYEQGDPIGRKTMSLLLSEWTGEKITEHTAAAVRDLLGLPRNEATGRPMQSDKGPKPSASDGFLLEDEQTDPMTREILVRSDRIKTLKQLLEVAEVGPEWEVSSWKANTWEQAQRDPRGGVRIVTLYQVKATLTRRLEAAHRPAQPTIEIKHERQAPRKKGVLRALFIPDLQCGYRWRDRFRHLDPMHDRKAMDACVKLAGQGFDVVFLLGDMADLSPMSSRFPTDPSMKATTQPTIDELHWWLARLRAAVGEDCQVIYLAGNHEQRVRSKMILDMEEAVDLAVAGETLGAMHIAKLLRLDELDIKWVGPYGADYWLWGRVRVTHGQTVRQGGGATSAAVLKGASWSEVFGHIHRLEYAEKTLHGPEGRRVISAMSPGCLCRLEPGKGPPGFKQRQDWQTGVGVAWLEEGTDEVYIQAIPIRSGRLIWSDGVIEGEDPTALIARDTGWTQFGG